MLSVSENLFILLFCRLLWFSTLTFYFTFFLSLSLLTTPFLGSFYLLAFICECLTMVALTLDSICIAFYILYFFLLFFCRFFCPFHFCSFPARFRLPSGSASLRSGVLASAQPCRILSTVAARRYADSNWHLNVIPTLCSHKQNISTS